MSDPSNEQLVIVEAATAATTTKRPTAQDFLELVERSKRGRLKLYIGFAAGVGKTWRMLEEAHALARVARAGPARCASASRRT